MRSEKVWMERVAMRSASDTGIRVANQPTTDVDSPCRRFGPVGGA